MDTFFDGNHSIDDTVEKLNAILRTNGITLFTLIDHSGEANKVGMKLRPTKLIFGDPKWASSSSARSSYEDPGLGRFPKRGLDFL